MLCNCCVDLFGRCALEAKVAAKKNAFAAKDLAYNFCWLSTNIKPV
jgi:hypothetical protein